MPVALDPDRASADHTEPLFGAIEMTVRQEMAGERLDVFIARSLPALSRAKIQKYIGNGLVTLNGRPAAKKTPVKSGDVVRLDKSVTAAPFGPGLVPRRIPLDILYQDEALLAVNKPAGMVMHPGSGTGDATLVHALLYHVRALSAGSRPDRPGIVHRLDKDTSGVVLVAKTDAAHAALARLFASREIKKEYVGICVGRRPDAAGTIREPVGRSRRDPVKRSVRRDGKEAITEYRLLAYACGVSVVRFSPRTGRTHQIRLHASAAGFPVLADALYGGGRDAVKALAVLDRPFAIGIFKCFFRHALHARSISFVHPFTNKEQTICAPFPQDFLAALEIFKSAGHNIFDSVLDC
jgi:23S rRNA pseudouridine1911/1915/1917 synthase